MNYADIIENGNKRIANVKLAFYEDKITREEMESQIRDIEYEMAEYEMKVQEEYSFSYR